MTNSHIADHTGTKQGKVESPCHTNCVTWSPNKTKINQLILRPSEKRSLSLLSQEWKHISQGKCLNQFSGCECVLLLRGSFVSLKDRSGLLSSHSFTSWPDITLTKHEHSMQSVWAIGSSDFYQMLVAFLGSDHSEARGNGCVMIRWVFSFWEQAVEESGRLRGFTHAASLTANLQLIDFLL